MKTLVTGGAGFVGSNLAAYLLGRGDRVTLFDSLARTGSADNLVWLSSLDGASGNLAFRHGDIRNTSDVQRVVKDAEPEVVFHLAGQVAMTTSMLDPRADFETNVIGSVNVLEAVRTMTPQTAVLYASSNKVYGTLEGLALVEDQTRYTPRDAVAANGVDEQAAKDFRTPYGCSKGAADQYMLDYARCFGLKTVVFRHSTIYGGRQFSTADQGWVGWFVRQALLTERDSQRAPFTISGNGKQVRDLLHVSDAVACYVGAFEHATRTAGEAFNIGGGLANSMSLIELLHHLERKIGISLRYEHLPWRHDDQYYFVANNEKIRRATGWSPTTTKERGIDDTIAWERSRVA